MEHAWLDSLSEDWVSQPGSVNSIAQLPPLNDSEEDRRRSLSEEFPSRIPRRTLGSLPPSTTGQDSNPLSERSVNDINISMQRLSTKARQEIKAIVDDDGGQGASGSANGSVVHNTVNIRSPSGRSIRQTPEWKRRLLQGDMQYGEQRDLFCSTAAGLQDMFKPPTPPQQDISQGEEEEEEEDEYEELPQHQQVSSMPSSPPLGHRRSSIDLANEVDTFEEDHLDLPNEVTPSPSPRRLERDVKYKLNMEDAAPTSTPPSMTMGQRGVYDRDQSALSLPYEGGTESRKTSGQSEIRNEDFSPILIGKHSDDAGKVEFAPIEMPADQLKQKLENLRINQMLMDPQANLEDAFDAGNETRGDDITRHGAYINTRRGGRSQEGSFLYRGLSPDLGGDSSEMLPEESLQASTPKQFPTIRIETIDERYSLRNSPSPSLPRAPFPSPEKVANRTANDSGQPGSPLKLFGPYDTFTNQTLLRRISQFEEGGSSGLNDDDSAAQVEVQQQPRMDSNPQRREGSYKLNEFGADSLHDYEFTVDNDIGFSDKENVTPDTSRGAHAAQAPRDSSPDEDSEIYVRRRRDKSISFSHKHTRISSTSSQRRQGAPHPFGAPEHIGSPKRDPGSEGKRPRTSPSKDPTPKRRRTLHRSDIAFGRENLAGIDSSHGQEQAAGRGKGSQGMPSVFPLADSHILASRPILRPRTTSGRTQSSGPNGSELDESISRPKTAPVLGHLQDSSLVSEDSQMDRKPSIRTQDFVDQAAQIMAMIRNQVRPQGLSSLEESEAEYATEQPSPTQSDDFGSESTTEPFSRPPSREGKPSVSRQPLLQDNPELIDRLKKYQELSDMGDVLSSLRSMGFTAESFAARLQEEASNGEQNDHWLTSPFSAGQDGVISDIPNIRITTNPALKAMPASPAREFLSDSSGRLTHRSYPTASSRGSESRRTIMPESVSHLIPDRVGSMKLDKNNNMWVKSKEAPPEQEVSVLPSDSEDDPFASIPDLSVDMSKELQNLKLATAQKAEARLRNMDACESPVSPSQPRVSSGRGYTTLSPNGQLTSHGDVLPDDEPESPLPNDVSGLNLPPIDEIEEQQFEQEDSEEQPSTSPAAAAPRRNMTITFSSPVASFIQEHPPEELDSFEEENEVTPQAGGKATSGPSRNVCANKSALKHPAQGNGRGTGRIPRNIAPRDAEFIPRPVSRIDEQDEDSTVELPINEHQQLSILGETSMVSHRTPDARRTSLSFILNHTPGNQALSFLADDSAMIGQNVGKLSLSPLSEFTVNNSDQSFGFEVSYVMGRRHMETGDGAKKVLTMTIRELVDKLSEVEPFEPYWEDLTDLDLKGKRLTSLHMLDEFCGRIVTLDASENTLAHLDGIPSTVRQLKVSQNMLTELTSWDHLWNLQYVDISGNEVKSLSALKNLVHLRSIKADNNQLSCLDGIDCHDGLLSLSARDNLIEDIDFTSLRLERLTELDLTGNRIRSLRKIEYLPSLTRLKLGKNRFETLDLNVSVSGLRQLDVSDNDLTVLDVSNLPSLQSLYADRNRLGSIKGLSRCKRLDSLSLREQRDQAKLDLSFLSAAYEIRKLFLSGNYLGVFEPQVDFLNLQLLELANCGLQCLPDNLGQLMPNLRSLNLNFNAIANLMPLKYIPRLKKLLCVGNRLADSTTVTELLTDFPHLRQLDLRDNPVTLGFYAPLQVLVCKDRQTPVDSFNLPEADVERDELYATRLDETTKLRRRLHQVVFTTCCKKLRMLDGLPVMRKEVFAQDEILKTLIREGLIPTLEEEKAALMTTETTVSQPLEKDVVSKDEPGQHDSIRSTRWNAEDSFA